MSTATWVVYKHLGSNGAVLYVGCTKNLAARTKNHRLYSPWSFAEVVVAAESTDQREALAIESALIRHWWPPCNTRGKIAARTTAREILQVAAEAALHRQRGIAFGSVVPQVPSRDPLRPIPAARRSA